MDLSEFLLARIAEDEQAARGGAGKPAYEHYGATAAEESIEMAWNEGCAKEGGEHFMRWLPARVLAECEAKRRIIGADWRADDSGEATLVRQDVLRALAL